MEHQKTLLILTFALLGILLLGQLGGLMEETPPETAVAEAYTGEPPVTVFGVVIREEAALPPLPEGDWVRWAVSGEKVAAGQILYAGSPPAERTEAALPGSLPARRQSLHQAIAAWDSARTGDGPPRALTALFRQGSGPPDAAPGPGNTVTADRAGVFSAVCDGLEAVLTPETPWEPIPLPLSPAETRGPGRIVTGDRWYLRTVLSSPPETETALEARLLGGLEQTVLLRVEEVFPRGEGFHVLFSCGTALEAVASQRYLAAELRPGAVRGVTFPASALCTRDGETGVWCVVGEATLFKPVRLLPSDGTDPVAEWDDSTTAGLWPGDRVLLDPPRDD